MEAFKEALKSYLEFYKISDHKKDSMEKHKLLTSANLYIFSMSI